MPNVYTRLLISKKRKGGILLNLEEIEVLLSDLSIKDKTDAARAEQSYKRSVTDPRKDLSWEYANERLGYNPDTGVVFWKKSKSGHVSYGDEAGTISSQGYRQISLDHKTYGAHRIAWLLHYKEWPEQQIDHINRNKLDNRIENLRDVSPSENTRNQARHDKGEA